MYLSNSRRPSTDRNGNGFDSTTVQAVWNKGQVMLGRDPSLYRKDSCGAVIYRFAYGDTTPNGMGWEVDHIQPASQGGSDALYNLQPLQWQNNRYKSDNYPQWSCAVNAA